MEGSYQGAGVQAGQEASGSQWSLAQQSRNPFKDVFVVVKKDKHANIGVRCPSPNCNVEFQLPRAHLHVLGEVKVRTPPPLDVFLAQMS